MKTTRRRQAKVPADAAAALPQLYADAVPLVDIAKRFGCSPITISKWAGLLGLTHPNAPMSKKITQEELTTMARMAKDGVSAREIAAEVGLNPSTVYNYVRFESAPAVPERAKGAARASGLTPKVRAELTRLYAAAVPVEDVADQLGVARNTIWRWAIACGLKHPNAQRRGGRQSGLTPEVRAQLADLYSEGVTVARIADQFGVRPGTISNWAAQCGLEHPGSTTQRRTDADVIAEICRLAQQGELTAEGIARQVGVTRAIVWRHAKGLLQSGPTVGPQSRNAIYLPAIQAGYAAGRTARAIAADLGITSGRVSGIAWRAGLTHSRRPQPKSMTAPVDVADLPPDAPDRADPVRDFRAGAAVLKAHTGCLAMHKTPSGGFEYCGDRKQKGEAFCAEHRRRWLLLREDVAA